MDGARNTNSARDKVTASANIACLGLDLGSVNVRGVLLMDGQPRWTACQPVRGRLINAVRRLLDELVPQHLEPDQRVRVQVTGVGRDLLHQERRIPICNEIVAIGDGARRICPDARSVFEIGGHTSRWVALDSAGEIEDYALSEACAAGTGAFIEQQAGRMQLDPAGLSEAAMAAERGAVVAGRCSVFAKTDMIHLQQKGVPTEEIAYGLCLAVARNVVATLLKGRRIPRPVALMGGASANRGLVRALAEVLELKTDLIVPPLAETCSALGAASTVIDKQETVVIGDLLSQLNNAEQQDLAVRAADIGLPCLAAAQESRLAEPTFTEAMGDEVAREHQPGGHG
jgi:predicted CoA-substrate-specific enzyme activase